jgi:hypothetical protein
MSKATGKIQKKPTAYKVTRKKEDAPEKVLTAEGYRRAMLKKHKMIKG